MRWRGGAVASCALLAAFALGQVASEGAWVPSLNGATGESDPMPYYFSGTDCRASGVAVCPGFVEGEPNWMVEAWLSLNGQVLKHWQHPTGEPNVTSTGLQLFFDSTHFPPGSQVEVRFKARDRRGVFYEASGSSVVKNSAKLHDLPEFAEYAGGALASQATAELSGSNIASSYLSDTWPTTVAATRIQAASVWVVWTHAGPTAHQCSPGQSDLVWASIGLGDQSYDYWRAAANGFGLPPFNDTHNQPVELALLLGCRMGETDKFLTAIEPHGTAYEPNLIRDKAVVAAYGKLFIRDGERLAAWFVDPLAVGMTVRRACLALFTKAVYEHSIGNESVYMNYDGDAYGDNPVSSFVELRVYGDRYTRIKNVYTGNDLQAPFGWYR